jgi:hypothetical protein
MRNGKLITSPPPWQTNLEELGDIREGAVASELMRPVGVDGDLLQGSLFCHCRAERETMMEREKTVVMRRRRRMRVKGESDTVVSPHL